MCWSFQVGYKLQKCFLEHSCFYNFDKCNIDVLVYWQLPPQKSEAEIQEEEELQLAIALSKSEEESKAKEVTPTSIQVTVCVLKYSKNTESYYNFRGAHAGIAFFYDI